MAASTACRRYACGGNAHRLRCFAERVEEPGDLRAAERLRAVVILPSDDGPAQGAFDGVGVEWDAPVLHEARQARPALDHVAHRFPEMLRGNPTCTVAEVRGDNWICRPAKVVDAAHPGPDLIEDGPKLLVPESPPFRLGVGVTGKRARD